VTSRRPSTGELTDAAPEDAPGTKRAQAAESDAGASAASGDDEPGLSAMRAVWLTMRDEAPPDRGLAELLAAARRQADVMRPPSLWQRLVAGLRRPPVLALATALVLIGGAVLIGRRLPDELSRPEPPAVSADPAGASRAGVVVQPRGETGSGQADERRRDPAGGPGAAEGPTDRPGNGSSATTDRPGGGDGLAGGGVGAVGAAAQDAPHPSPEAERASPRHATAPSAPALRPAERPLARDAVERHLAPPMPRARPSAPMAVPGAPVTPKDDGLVVGRDVPRPPAERVVVQRGASPPSSARNGAGASKAGEGAPSPTAARAGAEGRPGTGASSTAAAPTEEPARGENLGAKADDAPADSGPVAPTRRGATRGPVTREALAALYKQCAAAAQGGDCAAVKRLVEQIARTDRGYRARVAKDAAVAKCLAE